MDTIVKGEFRKAESKQGNAISKSAEVLEDERLLRVKTHILSVFNDYVVNHLQIQNQFYQFLRAEFMTWERMRSKKY